MMEGSFPQMRKSINGRLNSYLEPHAAEGVEVAQDWGIGASLPAIQFEVQQSSYSLFILSCGVELRDVPQTQLDIVLGHIIY